jgi:hypothetical protein
MFEVQIQDPMKHSYTTKKPREAQEGLVEDGKNRNANKRHERWQTNEKSKEKLKIKTERARRAQN